MSGDLFLDNIGEKGSNGGAGCGKHANKKADHAAPQDRHPALSPFFPARKHVANIRDGCRRRLADTRENLTNPEKGHRDHNETDAIQQPDLIKGKARDPGLLINADRADQQPEHTGGKSLEHRSTNRRERRQTKDDQREIFRWTEGQGGAGEGRGQDHEAQRRNRSGEERSDRRNTESCSGPSFQGHLVAIQRRHHAGWFAGDADQYRGERAAILRSIIDPCKKDDRGGRIAAKGQRQQKRNGSRWADARQRADKLSGKYARKAHQKIPRGQCSGEARGKIGENGHRSEPPGAIGQGHTQPGPENQSQDQDSAAGRQQRRQERQPFCDLQQEKHRKEDRNGEPRDLQPRHACRHCGDHDQGPPDCLGGFFRPVLGASFKKKCRDRQTNEENTINQGKETARGRKAFPELHSQCCENPESTDTNKN